MQKKQRSASKFFIFTVILIDILGIGIIIPVMPDLIMSLDGGSVQDAARVGGWLSFAYAIVQFFFAPVLGGLSDRYGRLPVMLIALFGLGMDYIFHAFAPTLLWLLIGRIIAGFFGSSVPVAYSYMADISKPQEKAKNFGLLGAAFGLGFIVGPFMGGVLGDFSLQLPFFAAAGLSFVNLIFGFFFVPESLSKEKRRPFEWTKANPFGALRSISKYPSIMGFIFAYFFLYLGGKAVETIWTYYTKYRFEWDQMEIGLSLAFVGILVTIVQGGLIGQTVKRLGQYKAIYLGFFFSILGSILFAFAFKGWHMYGYIVVYCLGGLAGPTLQSVMSNQVPDTQQGELQGVNTSLISITAIIAQPMYTETFSWLTSDHSPINLPGASFLLGAFFGLISLLLVYLTLKKGKENSSLNN